MVKILIKLSYLLLLAIISHSCSNKQYLCEGFDFKRLPYDSSYFYRNLHYTNGVDTIILTKFDSEFDTSSIYGQFGVNSLDCSPKFSIFTKDQSEEFAINYFFAYSPHGENKLNLSLHINFCRLSFSLDTLNSVTDISLGETENYSVGLDRLDWIKNIRIEKLRITMIEKYSGEKWYLVKEE